MNNKFVIAIDGPAASGKSTTAKQLAKKLKYIYIDTGAMYRASGLCTLLQNIGLDDEVALKEMLDKISIRIEYAEEGNRIYLNEKDVSERIREADVTKLSSQIAVIGIVRKKMVELQRKMGEDGGVIMDGRDIGTVVFPDAELKFFMTASADVRAQRRYKELTEKGEKVTFEEIKQNIEKRDYIDQNRDISPLKKADDAILLDNSNLTREEQLDWVMEKILSYRF